MVEAAHTGSFITAVPGMNTDEPNQQMVPIQEDNFGQDAQQSEQDSDENDDNQFFEVD